MGEMLAANGTEFWVERRGRGSDVLLIAGLGDPVEAWQLQIDGLSDRYHVTAFRQPWSRSDTAAVGAALGRLDG